MKTSFAKEIDFKSKLKKLENMNKEIMKSSTNNRIIISPERNASNIRNSSKQSHTKKLNSKKNSLINPIINDNPICINNYLHEKEKKLTNSVEKNKKVTSVFENRVLKNKRQNTEGSGGLNFTQKQQSSKNIKDASIMAKYSSINKYLNNNIMCETLTNVNDKKNILIDSIDPLDTEMLGKNYFA